MQTHLLHLCSLAAYACCVKDFPSPCKASSFACRSARSLSSSQKVEGLSLILVAVPVRLTRCQLSLTFQTQLFFYPLSLPPPLSVCLPFSFLDSATLLRRKNRVLKPVGAVGACVIYFNYSGVLLRIERRTHFSKMRTFSLFLFI